MIQTYIVSIFNCLYMTGWIKSTNYPLSYMYVIHSGKNRCWSCESVGFYRNQPAGKADFSEDGSVLAVIFGSVVTLWDPETNALRTTLSHGADRSNVRWVVNIR